MKNKYSVLIIVFLLAGLLQSCGWRLRGASELPNTLKFAVVDGVAEFSQVGLVIKQQITSSGAKVLSKADVDTIHFVVVENRFIRQVRAVDSAGRVSEYGISYDFALRVLDAKGKLLVAERAINLNRVYTYDPNNAIAKSDEEASIKSQMISFAVRQAMRRIGIKLRKIPAFNSSKNNTTGASTGASTDASTAKNIKILDKEKPQP